MSWIRTAVILGAGVGSRLRDVLDDRPKGFLTIGERPIVEESIEKLIRCGIHQIIIVAGYRREYYEALVERFPFVRVIINPEYETTGSMASLACACNEVQEDFLLVEADLTYEFRGLMALQNSLHRNSILLSGATSSGDEVYVGVRDNRIVNLSKDRSAIGELGGELVGVSRISLDLYRGMVQQAERKASERGSYHYEDCLTDLSGVEEIKYDLIPDLAWIEIDDESHLNKARERIYPLIGQRDKEYVWQKRVQRNTLLNPGPATTSDSVKMAMVVSDICPREKEFGQMVEGIRRDLVRIVHGEDSHEAVLFASSGTGAVEACLSSVVPPEKSVLIINNGAYGKRMQEICDGFGVGHIDYNVVWGDPIDLNELRSIVNENQHQLSHLALIHHETTVGILNPLREISQLASEFGLELIVDAMSSFAGIVIDVRTTKIDYLISSANKCIQGMAGVSFVLCEKTALERSGRLPMRNYYFNLYRNYQFFALQKQMQFTPTVQVLYALRQAINEYFIEGESGREERYAGMYERMRDGLESLGFRLLVPEEHRAKILTAIVEPNDDEYSFEEMHDYLKLRGFTIYPGKGARVDTFRLANMGALTRKDIDDFLLVLRGYVESRNIFESVMDGSRML